MVLKGIRNTIIFAILPVVAALYLFEGVGYLRRFLAEHCLLATDKKNECIACLKRLSVDFFPYNPFFKDQNISTKSRQIVPLSGVANVRTVFCNENKIWETFESDQYGFPNPQYVWTYKKLDVLLLGDSYVLGECVPEADRFAVQVQSTFPKTLNLSYSNTGPLGALARLVEYSHSHPAKNIYFFFSESNDPFDLHREMANTVFIRYLNEKNFRQGLEALGPQIALPLSVFLSDHLEMGEPEPHKQSFANFLKLNQTSETISNLFIKKAHAAEVYPWKYPDDFLNEMRKVLKRLREISVSQGAKATFVYLPSRGSNYGNFHDFIKEMVIEQDLKWWDAGETFKAKKIDPYGPYYPYHYNALGNQIIAQKILSDLSGSS